MYVSYSCVDFLLVKSNGYHFQFQFGFGFRNTNNTTTSKLYTKTSNQPANQPTSNYMCWCMRKGCYVVTDRRIPLFLNVYHRDNRKLNKLKRCDLFVWMVYMTSKWFFTSSVDGLNRILWTEHIGGYVFSFIVCFN